MTDRENVPKAAVYVRVTGPQAEASIDRQTKACVEFVEAHGLEIAGPSVDASDDQANRPELARLLDRATAGNFGMVVVEDLDRLPRDMIRSQIEAGGALLSGPWDVYAEQRRAVLARIKSGREAAKHRREALAGIRPKFTYRPGPKPKVGRRLNNAVRKLYEVACDAGGSPETMSALLSNFVRSFAAAQQRQDVSK